jgi:Fic family protein
MTIPSRHPRFSRRP